MTTVSGATRLSHLHSGVRYLGGAILCALINNVILIAGAHIGIPDFVGVLVAWFAGGTAGYLYHSIITFVRALRWRAYIKFMSGMTLGVPLTWLVLVFFRQLLHLPMELSAPATTVVLVLYNFINARVAIVWSLRKRPAG